MNHPNKGFYWHKPAVLFTNPRHFSPSVYMSAILFYFATCFETIKFAIWSNYRVRPGCPRYNHQQKILQNVALMNIYNDQKLSAAAAGTESMATMANDISKNMTDLHHLGCI